MKKTAVLTMVVALLCLLMTAGCTKKPAEPAMETASAPAEPMPAPAPPPAPVEKPAPPAPPVKAEIPIANFDRVHFAFDQSSLSAEARDILAANAVVLNTMPQLKVSIEGHCDNRGSDEYNMALGERRALAAKEYLISLGVPAERLQIISYGEEMPLDMASNETAWGKNRRAEFKKIQ